MSNCGFLSRPFKLLPLKPGQPRYISTLNSDRISLVLSNNGIGMENLPAVDLEPRLDAWPRFSC